METISKVAAIKRYFEANDGKKLSMAELKALTPADLLWLATECAKALGVELQTV